MLVVNAQEPTLDLAALLRHMESGDEVVIARAGRLVARLAPYEPAQRRQFVPGAMAGQIRIADDFDAPLDDLLGPWTRLTELSPSEGPVSHADRQHP